MAIPILFTLAPGNRHEVILVDTSDNKPSLKSLNKQLVGAMEGSPNCEEFMAQYKSTAAPETIQELKIHWAAAGRDRKAWPEYTVITEKNWPALLEMLRVGGGIGKDVLEIRMGVEGKGK